MKPEFLSGAADRQTKIEAAIESDGLEADHQQAAEAV
jgi:hypothetical protein